MVIAGMYLLVLNCSELFCTMLLQPTTDTLDNITILQMFVLYCFLHSERNYWQLLHGLHTNLILGQFFRYSSVEAQ